MADGVFKQSGQLFETSQEELQKQQQAATTPTSPAANAAAGGSPDAAKMAGTPAQKNNVLKAATAPSQTLRQAQRMYQPKQEAAPSEQARSKMERLKGFGSLETQIENLIQQKIDAAAQQKITQLQINEGAVQAEKEPIQAQLTTALQQYAAAPAGSPEREQALVAMSNVLGHTPTDAELQGYFQAVPEALAASAQEVMPAEQFKLGQIDISQLGDTAQIEQDLGLQPGQLQDMTLAEFQQAVQDTESREFNRIQNLQAQLVTATGAQREILMRELGTAAQAGITGIEAGIDRIQQQLDSAQTVNIAGQDRSLEEVFEDDALSDIIVEALRDEKALERLRQTEGGLAAWIEENKASLEAMQATAREEARGFGETQQQVAALGENIKQDVYSAIVGDLPQFMTSAERAALETKLQNSGLYQAIKDDPQLGNKLSGEEAKALSGYDKETINTLKEASQDLIDNPALADIIGLEAGKFITDTATADSLADMKSRYDIVADNPILLDSKMKDIIKNGTLSAAQLQLIADNPDEWADVKASMQKREEYDKIKEDWNKLSEFIFGGAKVEDVNATLTTLRDLAAAGDDEARKQYQKLKAIAGDDGKITKEDLKSLQTYASGNIASVEDAAKTAGANAFTGVDMTAASDMAKGAGQNQIYNLNKSGWNHADIMAMGTEELAKLAGSAYVPAYAKKRIEFAKNVKSIGNSAVEQAASDGKIDYNDLKSLKGQLDVDTLGKLINSGTLSGGYRTSWGTMVSTAKQAEQALRSKIDAQAGGQMKEYKQQFDNYKALVSEKEALTKKIQDSINDPLKDDEAKMWEQMKYKKELDSLNSKIADSRANISPEAIKSAQKAYADLKTNPNLTNAARSYAETQAMTLGNLLKGL